MAILTTDILYKYGASTGTSLAGAINVTSITDNVANNLWDDVTGAEAAAGTTEYRGFYVKNNHATLTWQSPFYWIDSQVSPTGSVFAIGLAAAAVNATETATANETTAPASVTFSTPVTKATGLAIPNIPATQYKGLWVRRVVTAGASAANATGSIRVEGDTAP